MNVAAAPVYWGGGGFKPMADGMSLNVSGADTNLFGFFGALFTVVVPIAFFVGIGSVVTLTGVFGAFAGRALGQV